MTATSEQWILLGSANGSRNLGDEAMWLTAAQELRVLRPGVGLVTDANSPEWDALGLPDVTVLPYVYHGLTRARPLRSGPGWMKELSSTAARAISLPAKESRSMAAYAAARTGRYTPLFRTWREAISRSRGVIFAGAGAVTSRHLTHGVLSWALICEWAAAADVPVCFLGQGIGPFERPEHEAIAQRALSVADVIGVREHASYERVLRYGVGAETRLAADWATLAVPDRAARQRSALLHDELVGGRPFIATALHRVNRMSPRDWRSVIDVLKATLAFAESHGLAVIFVPNMVDSGNNDDRLTARRIAVALGAGNRFSVVTTSEDMFVTRALLGRAELVVASRYHSAVFALAEGTPTVGVAINPYWHQKLAGAQRMASAPERVVAVPADEGRLVRHLSEALAERRDLFRPSDAIEAPEVSLRRFVERAMQREKVRG